MNLGERYFDIRSLGAGARGKGNSTRAGQGGRTGAILEKKKELNHQEFNPVKAVCHWPRGQGFGTQKQGGEPRPELPLIGYAGALSQSSLIKKEKASTRIPTGRSKKDLMMCLTEASFNDHRKGDKKKKTIGPQRQRNVPGKTLFYQSFQATAG